MGNQPIFLEDSTVIRLLMLVDTGDLRLSRSIIRKSRFIFTKERITIRQKSGCLNIQMSEFSRYTSRFRGQYWDSWK